METSFDFDGLRSVFSEVSKGDLEGGCFALRHFGLAEVLSAQGRPILEVSPTFALYWAFDAIVMHTDPLADAKELASRMLADRQLESVARLDEAVGWSRRRLNPAVARLIPVVSVVCRTITDRYPTVGFSIGSEDRFQLKRFIEAGD